MTPFKTLVPKLQMESLPHQEFRIVHNIIKDI
jgi:hypothetical protein